MKIGYQGMEGSNAEEATIFFTNKLGLKNIEKIPLISSKNVVEALNKKEIDYGVLATKNSYAGMVEETQIAIEESQKELEVIEKTELEIHHCIFKKNEEIGNTSLKIIASHVQALKQTENNRKKYFKNLQEFETEDTAIAAKYLANGVFSDDTAVICRKNAGEMFGLKLIYENIEDKKDNKTEFGIFKIK